jgi:thiol-disulfide isomerase/thioredoxin
MGLWSSIMQRRLALAAFAIAGLAIAGPAAAAAPPKVSITSYAELKTPLPYPYDEKADASAAVAAARAKAKAEHKLLLIDLGGNWCGDCRVLAGTVDLPEVKAFVNAHYVVVTVDVGRFDRNLQIPAHYGITQRLEGVPAILVVDPRTDKLVDGGHIAALADARKMTPQALADWLAQWTTN